MVNTCWINDNLVWVHFACNLYCLPFSELIEIGIDIFWLAPSICAILIAWHHLEDLRKVEKCQDFYLDLSVKKMLFLASEIWAVIDLIFTKSAKGRQYKLHADWIPNMNFVDLHLFTILGFVCQRNWIDHSVNYWYNLNCKKSFLKFLGMYVVWRLPRISVNPNNSLFICFVNFEFGK